MYKLKPFYKEPEFPLIAVDEIWTIITDLAVPNVRQMYFVSNYGRVYSVLSRRILKPAINKDNGYYVVNLYMNDGSSRVCTIHRVMMMSFFYFPGCEEYIVNHKDGNKLNIHLSNLEWGTYAYNAMHASQNGLLRTGENASWTTLSDNQVHQICQLYNAGVSRNNIAEQVGCKINRVHEILEGKSRTNISSLYGIETRKKVYKHNLQEASTTKA